VIQLGENPERVFNVGAIGLDHITRSSLLSIEELSESLNFSLTGPYMILTYHPVTLADESPTHSFRAILSVLDDFPEYQIIITYPNADDGGRSIIPMIEHYACQNPRRVLAIPSLGFKRFLSAVKYAAVVLGNSSSGIIEVPSFNVPTVNIGERQKGRISAKSVIHCKANKEAIGRSLLKALANNHGLDCKNTVNPYGQGNTSQQIVDIIKSRDFSGMKSFFDLVF
jgi:UDP-N-acetylglucosamine 2-epimerase (non-hydrolysing)